MQPLGLVPIEESEADETDEEVILKVCGSNSINLDAKAWTPGVPEFSTPCSLERKLFEILRDECLNGTGVATLTFLAHNACAFESDAKAILSACSWATYQYGKYRLHDELLAHKDTLDKMCSVIPSDGWRHPKIKIYNDDEDDIDKNIGYTGSSQNLPCKTGFFVASDMLHDGMPEKDEIPFDDLESDFFEAESYDSDDFD